jgi:hypothetical protein
MSTIAIGMKPLAEITQDAIRVLCQELGIVNTIRFVNQFTIGYGNYTEEREELFADLTMDDIVTAIKRKQTHLTTERRLSP